MSSTSRHSGRHRTGTTRSARWRSPSGRCSARTNGHVCIAMHYDRTVKAERPGTRINGERLSLLTKVARLYHEQGIRQPEIAERLSVSQSRVSRLLKEAVTLGVVR